MGKGDKKSKRGKIVIKSYGVRRPRSKKHAPALPVPEPEKVEKPKKAARIAEKPPVEEAVKPEVQETPAAEKPKSRKKAAS